MPATFSGKQIRDDTVESIDIKDGTIELVDLHPDLQALLNGTSEPGGTGLIDPFHQYVEYSVEESTTSQTWQPYLTIITEDLPDGNYRIANSVTYRISRNNRPAAIRVVVDGIEVSSISKAVSSGSDEYDVYTDFAEVNLSGVTTIEVHYRRTSNQAEVFVQKARIELRRVSLNV